MASDGDEPAEADPVLFDAVLCPHRSLGPVGFAALMGLVGLVGFAGGVAFLLLGAWPVAGFGVAEMLLFHVLFRLNYRGARAFERVRLTLSRLTVERHDARGRMRSWSFQAYWLKVAVAEPDGHLVLSSHGRTLAIGGCLSAAERLAFAQALRRALDAARAAQP